MTARELLNPTCVVHTAFVRWTEKNGIRINLRNAKRYLRKFPGYRAAKAA